MIPLIKNKGHHWTKIINSEIYWIKYGSFVFPLYSLLCMILMIIVGSMSAKFFSFLKKNIGNLYNDLFLTKRLFKVLLIRFCFCHSTYLNLKWIISLQLFVIPHLLPTPFLLTNRSSVNICKTDSGSRWLIICTIRYLADFIALIRTFPKITIIRF